MSRHSNITDPQSPSQFTMVSDEQTPQRLSALYQYHNAPEVAPAHGLEYDDTIYPTSDKYPVIHTQQYEGRNHGSKRGFEGNRPPRIIFGMKVRTFSLVASIFASVIIGAAVGGAVGGKSMREGEAVGTDGSLPTTTAQSNTAATLAASPSSSSSSSTTSTTTSALATPTIAPLTDCTNNTLYTSTYSSGSSGTVPSNAGSNFTRYCDTASPLSSSSTSTASNYYIAEAFVYTFADCIEVCAGYNFYAAGSNCSVAVYEPGASRPGNCWVGHADVGALGVLGTKDGVDVALLSS